MPAAPEKCTKISDNPFQAMVSDTNNSKIRCEKRGGMNQCGDGEACGLWIHNGDDREYCVDV